jgi:hypothetical protein
MPVCARPSEDPQTHFLPQTLSLKRANQPSAPVPLVTVLDTFSPQPNGLLLNPPCFKSPLHFQLPKPHHISKPCLELDQKSLVVSFYTPMGAGTPFPSMFGSTAFFANFIFPKEERPFALPT